MKLHVFGQMSLASRALDEVQPGSRDLTRSTDRRFNDKGSGQDSGENTSRLRLGPPTIIDVARDAGLSRSTASRALSGSTAVSAEARSRAEAAARRLGYTPNALARSMIRGSSEVIGVLVPDVATPYFARAVRGIADVARSAGFEVLLANTDGDPEVEARALQVLTERRSDGIIVAPAIVANAAHLARAIDAGTPLVQLDRRVANLSGASSVTIDNAESSCVATRHLLQLNHRTIAVISESAQEIEWLLGRQRIPRQGLMPSAARLAGYLRALREKGVMPDRELIVHSEYTRDAAVTATKDLLERRPDVTAILCTDGVLTSGAFEALQRSGRICPRDISLVGFDDQEWMTMVRPELTVVAQPDYQLGWAAAQELLNCLIHGRPPRDVRFRASLVVRNSTAAHPT